jgi:hypothetical protein
VCAGVEAGDGRIVQCLAEHGPEIGKPCRAALRRAKRVAAFRAGCGADVGKLCTGVKPGAGSIHQCLRANEASVSASCKARLAKGNNKKVVADAAGLADEAVAEEQQGMETLPELLPIMEEPPAGTAEPQGAEPQQEVPVKEAVPAAKGT